MATLGTTAATLADWAKRVDDNGKIAEIVEILNQSNEILEDMAWVQGNLPTGHKTTIRSGLPTPTWRLLNYGVQPTKSRTVQVTDSCGMLEAYSEIDKSLADLNGNTNEFRLSEDRPHFEGMNIEMAKTLFYGNTATDPEKFMGLAPRYNSLSAENAVNIVDGAGTTGNTSIWLIVWGDMTAHGIFPKGGTAGMQHEDLGRETVLDAAGGRFEAYRSHYKWDCGFTLRDWRYVVRIANVRVSTLTKDAASGANLVDLMTQALELVPNLRMGRPVFYANKRITSFLRRQIANKVINNLSLETAMGRKVMSFDDVPVKRCDAILNTESQVT